MNGKWGHRLNSFSWMTVMLFQLVSPAEAGVDLSNPSPVNLLAAILMGLFVGGLVFIICWLIRVNGFAKVVRKGHISPKESFFKFSDFTILSE